MGSMCFMVGLGLGGKELIPKETDRLSSQSCSNQLAPPLLLLASMMFSITMEQFFLGMFPNANTIPLFFGIYSTNVIYVLKKNKLEDWYLLTP